MRKYLIFTFACALMGLPLSAAHADDGTLVNDANGYYDFIPADQLDSSYASDVQAENLTPDLAPTSPRPGGGGGGMPGGGHGGGPGGPPAGGGAHGGFPGGPGGGHGGSPRRPPPGGGQGGGPGHPGGGQVGQPGAQVGMDMVAADTAAVDTVVAEFQFQSRFHSQPTGLVTHAIVRVTSTLATASANLQLVAIQ